MCETGLLVQLVPVKRADLRFFKLKFVLIHGSILIEGSRTTPRAAWSQRQNGIAALSNRGYDQIVDVHFILGGQRVTRENWNTFGPDVTEANLDRISDAVLDVAESLRCKEHKGVPAITCRGVTLDAIEFEVAACCPNFERALAGELQRRVRPERLVRAEIPGVERTRSPRRNWRRMNRTFGPILAGMVIDMVDLATFGPMKRFVGLPAGALAGYWMASIFRLPLKQKLLCALAAAIYCVIPGLEFIPVATLLGAYIRFRTFDDPLDGGD